ncbi:E3 ubiquitin-protein ligase Topors [Nasonia vitripennis]|uniref:E3 ubiquitin-protein ligase Topors n=1 Tax=Nasonia vitripennis TaxID=7425 RepID=A0A7M7PWN1_NASVI|nr:E3 ubiquitin-protein ligase Topors [Nasonia vitripennis]XP_031776827.1 E3 ubiquitin-protein ligase Topors [Nasonia vitripennis]XP_031776828.1 E3 ubiquitin-protein ligase Topors [Nasonia vitripennis]
MESLERKDASTGPEEPIKAEDVVASPNTSERSNNAASPPPNCSICLGHLINMSFTDSCLHQFCFSCLLQWSKIKTECPLCKQTFKSIIHNVRSQEDYDQYHVQRTSQVAATLDVTADIHISGQWNIHPFERPFFYRTTMGAQAHRRYGMLLNPEAVARREQIPSVAPQVSNEERRRRHANPIDYRRTVYRHGVWAAALPDAFGRFRESSAEFYRRHPSEVNRLIPWLNRELQVLLNNNRPHIAYVMGVITDTLTQYDIRSDEFRNTVRQYFGIHTDHFVHELSNYARTNFDLVGYDQAVSYIPSRGLSNEYVHRPLSPTLSTSSTSSNDSDVYVLPDSNSRISYMPHMIDAPGPSTVGQVFRVGQPPSSTPDVLTISSTSSSSENECEVIGYVKPRHERTPEIIDLSSSDGENRFASTTSNDNSRAEALLPLKEENLPSTSSSAGDANSANSRTRRRIDDSAAAVQMYTYLDSTSESDSGENDSDYNPKSRKSRRHKTSGSKKSSKAAPRKLRSHKRKSASTQQKRNKETRSRSYYSSGDESDNESPQRGASSSRAKKRYLSNKSSDASETDKVSKKKKKSKKSTSSKKTKKRRATSSTSSKTTPLPMCEHSSIYSSNSCNDSEPDNSKSSFSCPRETSKASGTTNYHDYTSEEPSDNDKSSSKSSSAQRQESKASSKFGDSDLSDYRRSESSRRSSTGSYDSRKIADRLQNMQDDSRHCTSDDEIGSSHGSSCSDNESDSASLDPKRKLSGSKSRAMATSSGQTTSQSSEKSSATASSSNSSSKSGASSPTEHSSQSKSSRDRHRSHKKRKESKKRKRSHS